MCHQRPVQCVYVKQHNRLHLHGIANGGNRHQGATNPLGHSPGNSHWRGLLAVELGYEEPQSQLERQLETGHHLLHLLPYLVSYVHVLYVVTMVTGKGGIGQCADDGMAGEDGEGGGLEVWIQEVTDRVRALHLSTLLSVYCLQHVVQLQDNLFPHTTQPHHI